MAVLVGTALSLALCVTPALSQGSSGAPEVVKPGGALAALKHRSELRDYARKMVQGELSAPEVADYITKGGSYQAARSYDSTRDFLVGAAGGSVLRFFIDGPHVSGTRLPPDRLESLALLLEAGADPNLLSEDSGLLGAAQLSPTLFAAAGNDLPALRLLVAKGGKLDQREQKYAATYGPALALATRSDVLDFLLASGANLGFKDDSGANLMLMTVEQAYGSSVLDRVRWLLAQGVSPLAQDQHGTHAVKRAGELLKLAQSQSALAHQEHEQHLKEAREAIWPGMGLDEKRLAERRQALEADRVAEWEPISRMHTERLSRLDAVRQALLNAAQERKPMN
ncbi:hypothetical protein [Hydrogenophaga sp. 5NK40-0174]|uniref:hypothetical protein n=1 Tax=Hydrogenophaga sp. 5NK40-0174 TaxID=3127649 RepID=UPI00310478A9